MVELGKLSQQLYHALGSDRWHREQLGIAHERIVAVERSYHIELAKLSDYRNSGSNPPIIKSLRNRNSILQQDVERRDEELGRLRQEVLK